MPAEGNQNGAVRVLSWNLYHGRDRPPNPALYTLRSRLLGRSERDATHVQVNRALEAEFAAVIASAEWSMCLLQESPPAWAPRLAARTGAAYHCVLTARNQLAPLTRRLARWNPDLVGSWEGGSNLTLVRPDWKIVAGSERSLLLNPLLARRLRERRRMSFVRVRSKSEELCVGNLHASHYDRRRAEEDVWRAAVKAVAWAGDDPLILGGDFNLRPRTTTLFDRLERELGLSGATADDAIDHILARGLESANGPIRWPDARREVEVPSNSARRRLRLSDHNPVEATFRCY